MTSNRQSKANKKNAELSSGPLTPEGKSISSRNALQHGILSQHIYIHEGDLIEYNDFVEFRDNFFQEWGPKGFIETMLVDRLFATWWRLRRLHIAEAGMIEKQIMPQILFQGIERMKAQGMTRIGGGENFFSQMSTSLGCSFLADGWQAIYELLVENGLPLSEGISRALDEEYGGRSGFLKAEHVSICNYAVRNKNIKPLSEEDEKRCNEWALHYAKDLSNFFRSASELLECNEIEAQKADLKSKIVPDANNLEKIQRYDAHLQRTFLTTLHELQRIQGMRLGTPVSSAALDITMNSENGFVS